jgi:hypothetical protein
MPPRSGCAPLVVGYARDGGLPAGGESGLVEDWFRSSGGRLWDPLGVAQGGVYPIRTGWARLGQISVMPDAACRSATAWVRRVHAQMIRRGGTSVGPKVGRRRGQLWLPRICQDAGARDGSTQCAGMRSGWPGPPRGQSLLGSHRGPCWCRGALPWRLPRVISPVRAAALRGEQIGSSLSRGPLFSRWFRLGRGGRGGGGCWRRGSRCRRAGRLSSRARRTLRCRAGCWPGWWCGPA